MQYTSQEYNDILSQFFHAEKVGEYKLKNTLEACTYFGSPQKQFQSIHIAGTNGKGSTVKMIYRILNESGLNVGVFTSPHFMDIRERFETMAGRITELDFVRYAKMIIEYGGDLSYFERCAILAFLYFRDQGCTHAVIEVGLGGRLDATNIIEPILSIITSIGYDHMEFLGNTLEEIAYEKGGIIKPGVPVILYGPNPTLEIIATERGATVIHPTERHIETNLLGPHQLSNARIAYEAGCYLGIDERVIEHAFLHIDHPGRMQYLTPNLLIDGAHNSDGLHELAKYLDTLQTPHTQRVYCINLKFGKSPSLVLDTFPSVDNWRVLDVSHPLVSRADAMVSQIGSLGRSASIITPDELIAEQSASPDALYIVFGSLYILGEVMKRVGK